MITLDIKSQKLELNDKNLSILFDNAPIGYLILTQQFEVIKCNNKAKGMFSCSRNNNFLSLISPIYKNDFIYWMNVATCSLDIQLDTKQWVRLDKSVWLNSDCEYILLTIIDISHEKDSEIKLKNFNQLLKENVGIAINEQLLVYARYEHLFNNLLEGVLLQKIYKDEIGNFLEYNYTISAITGYSPYELSDMNIYNLIHQKYIELFNEYLLQDKLFFETVIVSKDGNNINVEMSIHRFMILEEAYLLVTIRDLSNIKKLQNLFGMTNKKLDTIQNLTKSGYLTYSFDTKEFIFSKGMYKLLGYEKNDIDMCLDNILSLVHQDDKEMFLSILHDPHNINKIHSFSIRLKTKDDFTPFRIVGKIIADKNKHIELVGFFQDVTQEIAEKAKQKEQEKLLIQQSKMASMGEMIGAIAHQWRQPLNIIALLIQSYSELFEDGELDKEVLDKLEFNIMNQINYMSKTIDDFRNFFKPDREQEPFDVFLAIDNTLKLISTQLKNHSISYDINNDTFMLIGYKNEFQQAILNIINNSKDALIEKNIKNGHISINITKDTKNITIQDNGGGIDSELIDRIFEPYFTTKEEGKGTGIGLYMTKVIIQEGMNGKISVQNKSDGLETSIKF